MSNLTFYQQKRYDGGTRMGIKLTDDTTVLGLFEEGRSDTEDDPLAAALEWYVDLRCKGSGIPTDHEGARAWFLAHAADFRSGINGLADAVSVGWDDTFPVRWSRFTGLEPGLEVELVCSSINRVSERSLSEVIRQFGDNLESNLRRLQPLESVLE